jgi:hypothetical protein
MVVWRHDAAHLRAIDNTSSARLPGNGGALAALALPTLETQSSANLAIGTVPGVMRQSLSGAATFRIRIVANDSSVPIMSALTVAAR